MNSVPLPAVPEVFGVRLPPQSECLTAVDFDLVPNKPPPAVKLYDEEIEEIEESESESEEDDEDMEPATFTPSKAQERDTSEDVTMDAPFPISAVPTQQDLAMMNAQRMEAEEGSDGGDDEDGLFAGGDDEEEESDAMEEVSTSLPEASNGIKRKLVEEDDYD